jgi:putative ATP-dependent endonuclease of OLD family
MPTSADALETQEGLKGIVSQTNTELAHLFSTTPNLQLRITSTDSSAVLESAVSHFQQGSGPTLPAGRQGAGLVSLQSLLLLVQLGRARSERGLSFVLALEEPELHIQPSQQKRLVNRLNALCDQTIVTTHSPLIASMFEPSEVQFIANIEGNVKANSLVTSTAAQPSNHEQHLFFAWRQRFIAALLHDHVLVPEGYSDVAWLEALQISIEMHQTWTRTQQDDPTRFSTFVGLVPTSDAKIYETYEIARRVHRSVVPLVDGDAAGIKYIDRFKASRPPPPTILVWPDGWDIERVVAWIAEASLAPALVALETALGQKLSSPEDFATHLRSKKTYAPDHHTIGTILAANTRCRQRIESLLSGIADTVRGIARTNLPFEKWNERSTSETSVFRLKL